jgi:hypothetical protein
MALRFLIDECLTPELVDLAIAAGHPEATCVRDRALLSAKDWQLMRIIVTADYTLVTNNAFDFRGHGNSGPGGHYSREPIHAGLVCLHSERSFGFNTQRELFQLALDDLVSNPDLVNQVLEVYEAADGTVEISRYELSGEPSKDSR